MAFVDPINTLERQRLERKRYLESKVAETLALKPSKPGSTPKRAEHGTYKLSLDEEQQAILQYQRQSRQARILQVRAQESLLAAECVGEFRQRKKREKQELLRVLKEAWQEEREKRKAEVEVYYRKSCEGIGQSHEAAQIVAQDLADLAEKKATEAEENELWGNLRFHQAMKEENARRSEALHEKKMARRRRKVLSEAAAVERRRARSHALEARSEAKEQAKLASNNEEEPEKYLKIDFDSNNIRRNFIQSRLPGAPSDYKDTYFHSRFSVFKNRSNPSRCSGSTTQIASEAEVDAWEAAEVQMKSVELEKGRKTELEEVWKRRKAERGQAAAAKLQKIASLEKELAVELEEEQERRHQLKVLEQLTRIANSPSYKPDPCGRLQPTDTPPIREPDESCDAKSEDCGSKMPRADEYIRPDLSQVFYSGSTILPQEHKQRENIVVEPLLSPVGSRLHQELFEEREAIRNDARPLILVVDDKQSAQEFTVQVMFTGNEGANLQAAAEVEGTQQETLKFATLKEERSVGDRNLSSHASQSKVPRLSINRSSSKSKDKDTATQHSSSTTNLPCCTPRSYNAGGRATKDADSKPKVSSLPHLSRKNGVRKGNKSPQKLEGRGEPALKDHQNEDYMKELRNRSIDIGKDEARPSVDNMEETPVEGPTLPAIGHLSEDRTTEHGKKSPRKESSTWLSNILEKFSWWKSDSCTPRSGALSTHEKDEIIRPQNWGKETDRSSGWRSARKGSTPRSKQADSPTQDPPSTRRDVPFKLEALGSLNTLRETDWYCEEQPGWAEARTKAVFSKEELEALKLELYGTLTGEQVTSHQKKAILRKEKIKPEPKPQGLSVLPTNDLLQKARPLANENDQLSRLETITVGPDSTNPAPKLEKTKEHLKASVHGPQEDNTGVPYARSNNKCYDPRRSIAARGEQFEQLYAKPPTKESSTQCTSPEFECKSVEGNKSSKASVERKQDETNTSSESQVSGPLQDQVLQPGSLGPNNHIHCAAGASLHMQDGSAASSLNIMTSLKNAHSVYKDVNNLGSAREVAEEVIRAWRAAQLGGETCFSFERPRESRVQASRKRRVTQGEEAQVSTSYPGTTRKLGQLRERMKRPQQNSATKLRKWDVSTPGQGAVLQDKRDSNMASVLENRERGSKRVPSPFKGLQPSQRKEEDSRLLEKKCAENSSTLKATVVVPEGRSLDFILGSLSAQVRELDERLQSVTACSMGTMDTCSAGPLSSHEEYNSYSGSKESSLHTSMAGRVSEVGDKGERDLQHSTLGELERFKIPGFSTEQERINRGRTLKSVQITLPTNPCKAGQPDESQCYLQDTQAKSHVLTPELSETRLDLPSSSSLPQAQSPVSSMGICLEDMADLMQEMKGSPSCEKMRAQLLQDSFLENLPRRRNTGTIKINKPQDSQRSSGAINPKAKGRPGSKCQEDPGYASTISFKQFAAICSGKAGPSILKRLAASDVQDYGGIMGFQTQSLTRCNLWPLERVSHSSLDLEEAMRLNGSEEQTFLTSSVDFSPWNTQSLPDVFASVTDVRRSLNNSTERGRAQCPKEGDRSLSPKPVFCHIKGTSKYLLKNDKFKKRCKAYEKRLARGKGKQKKAVQKASPVTLVSKLPGFISPNSNATRSLQATPMPGVLNLSKKDMKLTKDARTKSTLTSRSLPAHFPFSVAVDEVQRWLRIDATGPATSDSSGRSREFFVKNPQFPGSKKPEGLATAGRSFRHPQEKASLPLVMTTPEICKKDSFDRKSLIQKDLEARRRPASAGIVMRRQW